jgi:predicted kinase
MSAELQNRDTDLLARRHALYEAFVSDLLSSQDLASRYHVSLRTIRYWEAKGLLLSRVKWRRRLMYSVKALESWEKVGLPERSM